MRSGQHSQRASFIGASAVEVKPALYGDEFGGVPAGKWPTASHSATPPRPSDYAEIFGGFSATCSIPVLDLPPAADQGDDLFRTCSALDYLDIFGGLDANGFGVSYEELLYGHQRNEGSQERSDVERNVMGNNLHPSSVSGSFVLDLQSDNATHLERYQGSPNRAAHILSSVKEHPNEASHMSHQPTTDTIVDATRNETEFCATNEFTFIGNACSQSPTITSSSPRCPPNMIPGKQSVLNDEIYRDNAKNLGPNVESASSIKGSGSSQNSDEKQSSVKSVPEDASAAEQYHSCSSDNSNDGESSFNKQSTSDESVTSAIYAEEYCFKRETHAVSVSSVNHSRNELADDQKRSDMKSNASENLPCKIYNSQSADFHYQNSDTDFEKNNREAYEETIPSVSVSSAKVSREMLGDKHQQMHTFSNMPSSARERSHTSTAFLTVSDINLRTQPSQVPPPSRPPPKLTLDQGNLRVEKTAVSKVQPGESGSGLSTIYRMKTVSRTSESETPKQMGKSNSQPFYDVEIDVSSAASASVVAVKEAMEQAEARLKRTKEMIARKKDSLQMKTKLGTSESAKLKGKRVDEPAVSQSFTDHLLLKVNVKISHERSDSVPERGEKDVSIDSGIPYIIEKEKPFKVAEKPLHGRENTEFRPVQDFVAEDDRIEERKAEQFLEIVSNDKKFKKVHDASTHDGNKRKPEAVIIGNGERDEKTTSTAMADNLVCNDKLLNANIVSATEDDSNRSKEPLKVVNIPDVSRNNNDKLKENNRAVNIEEVEIAKKTDPGAPDHENDAILKETSDCYQRDKTCCLSDSKEFSDGELQKEMEILAETCSHVAGIHNLNSVNKDCHSKQIPQNVDKEKPSVFCKCKKVLESMTEEQKSRVLEQAFPCEGDLEEINETHNYCDPSYAETKLRSESESFKHLENEQKVGGHLTADACGEKAELGGPDVTIAATDSTIYDEKLESRLKESTVESEQDEIKDSEIKCTENKRTQKSGKDSGSEEEEVSRVTCSSEESDRKLSPDEEAEACSVAEVEKETNDEHCWQYFCEKLIRESKIELHPDEEKQQAAKADGELSVSGTGSSGSPSVDELGNNEDFHDLKLTNDSKIENYKSAPHVDYHQASERDKKLEDAEAHSIDHSNGLSKSTQEISKPSSAEVLDRAVPENLKNEDTAREERSKREREEERERARTSEEEKDREREREKDRLAFEKTTLDIRERAFAEARERAERAAVERVTAEARQRALAEAREKTEKAFAEALSSSEKASREARLRAERALAELAARETKAERSTTANKDSRRKDNEVDRNSNFVSRENQGMKQNTNYNDSHDFSREPQRYSDSSNHARSNEKISGQEGESAIRSRARWERHQRTSERAAKALAEKNLRDTISQREQAERNRLSEILDADVRRWSNGKEGNLRALLSTLQYILGPESGWQPVPLTDVITAAAVKKAYRKATLCVHPDKLQQRGANIQQKYICEKVFDLLKEAWNKFNSEER